MNPLLIAAVTDDDAVAHASWRSWRQAVDIQHAAWRELQLVPILNGPRFRDWLADDPEAGLLRGIVRKAWTESQMRLATGRQAIAALTEAGCDRVTFIGAAALHLRHFRPESIRPIPELRLLIPREHVGRATAALQAEGWQMFGRMPEGAGLDWTTHLAWARGGTHLYLHWRVLDVAPRLVTDCEREFLANLRGPDGAGAPGHTLLDGHALLEALADRPRSETADMIPWQIDAALLAGRDIDWAAWTSVATTYAPGAIGKISELRRLGVRVPLLTKPRPSLRRMADAVFAGLRRVRRAIRRGAR